MTASGEWAPSAGGPVVGLLGYGEVGRILAEDLRNRGVRVIGYDVKVRDHHAAEPLQQHAERCGVALVRSATQLAAAADLVISAVTADQTVPAANSVADSVEGTIFLDLNSASPGSKSDAASRVEAAGGRYVEGAVMAPVPPQRSAVPVLIGGPHAKHMIGLLTELGLNVSFSSERLGVASATKMCRSVVIKGLEAIMIESLTTARAWGVEDNVLASLTKSYPGIDWDGQTAYFFQRVAEHGRRRAEEMREAAATVREVGLPGSTADGSAAVQQWMTELCDVPSGSVPEWRQTADRLLSAIGKPGRSAADTKS